MGTLGKRILLLRHERGLRQGELARQIGLSQKTISDIERDKSPGLRAETVAKLAGALDVSADYLLDLIDYPEPLSTRRQRSGVPA